MIKIELVENSSYFGKWFINTRIKWQESLTGFEINSTIPKENISYKLEGKFIKLTCGVNEYFVIDKIKGKQIQYISSATDDQYDGALHTYKNKPNELYINLGDGLIDMNTKGELLKRYLIKVVDKNHQKVEYHGLIFTLIYKKNTNEEFGFNIDINPFHHEAKSINFLGYTVDISFVSILIYWVLYSFFGKKLLLEKIDYTMIAVAVAYLFQIILRTIYIKNTWVNCIGKLFKGKKYRKMRKSKKRFTKRGFEKNILTDYLAYIAELEDTDLINW